MPQGYHRRRRSDRPGRLSRFELITSAIVLVAVIATLVVFLFVFHDLPLRLSGGY